VINVRTNETIVTGLSMPHSPRVYRDQLWLLDSGTGHFGRVDRATGQFERLTFCPFRSALAVVCGHRPRTVRCGRVTPRAASVGAGLQDRRDSANDHDWKITPS